MKRFNKIIVVVLLIAFGIVKANSQANLGTLIAKYNQASDKATIQLIDSIVVEYGNRNIDSCEFFTNKLLSLAKREKDNYAMMLSYNRLASVQGARGNMDSAISLYKHALTYREDIKNKMQQHQFIDILLNMANTHLWKGDLKEGMSLISESIQAVEQLLEDDDKKFAQVKALRLRGEVYNGLALYDLASKDIFRAIEINEKSKKQLSNYILYGTLGSIYYSLDDNKNALTWFKKAISDAEDRKAWSSIVPYYTNLASIYLALKEKDSSIFYLDKSYKQSLTDNNLYAMYSNDKVRGRVYSEFGEWDSGILYSEKALKYFLENEHTNDAADAEITIGEIYVKKAQYEKAKGFYLFALEKFKLIEMKDMIKMAYASLSECEELAGNSTAALAYMKQANLYRDSTISEEKQNAITAQEIKYETSLKETQISKQKIELKANKQRQNWLLGGGSLALITATGLGLLYRRTRKQKEQIKEQHQRIELLNEDILHSSKNNLNLMTTIFERQSTEIDKADSAIASREIAFTLSALQHQLYEKQQPNGNLKQYLETLCKAKESAFKVPVKLEYQCPDNLNLSARMLQNMGLIFNELSTNAVKYAFEGIANPLITLSVSQPQPKLLKMTLRDNGKGLPPFFDSKHFADSQGMGLVADLVAPKGNIKTYNDNGACFEISLPI